MFTFIHAADIHLDSPLCKLEKYEGAPVDAMRGATRRALENLIGLALERTVDFLLISGDLYDGGWKDYNTGLYFVSQMSRLREADIPVYIIAGNHDASSRMSKTLRLPENVHLFPTDRPATQQLDQIGVAIHGQGFASPAVKQNLAVNYPAAVPGWFNIGLLHTGANGRENHEPYAPCSLADLAEKQYDYWALGHIHQHEILYQQPLVVFSGNLQGRHIRETGPKGCVVVAVDDHHRAETTFHPLDVIRWAHVHSDISAQDHAHEVVAAICQQLATALEQSEGRPLAVRITIAGESAAHEKLAAAPDHWIGQIRSAALDIGGGRIWIEKVRLHSARRQHSAGELPAGPLSEIVDCLADIQNNPQLRTDLYRLVEEVQKKLPRELKEKNEILRFNDPLWFPHILEQVRDLLLHRLLSKGGFE